MQEQVDGSMLHEEEVQFPTNADVEVDEEVALELKLPGLTSKNVFQGHGHDPYHEEDQNQPMSPTSLCKYSMDDLSSEYTAPTPEDRSPREYLQSDVGDVG